MRITDALRWLPAAVAAGYVATVAVLYGRLVGAIGWDSDIAAPYALAERLRGRGPVFLQHNGLWTRLWWLLGTRDLPGHATLWKATGYGFALAGAVVLGWATSRVAGTWAGVAAGATALLVGPIALRSLLTIVFHVSTPFTAIVLAAYVVLLAQSSARLTVTRVVLAVLLGAFVGANAASDALNWVAAVLPFAAAVVVLVVATRRKDVGVQATITIGAAIVAAVTTDTVMRGLGYHVIGGSYSLAALHQLPGHVLDLGRLTAFLGGANYAIGAGYPREPFRIVLALLVLAGVCMPFVAAFDAIRSRQSPALRAFASFWAASVALLAVSFVATTNAAALGAGSFNYLLSLAPAAAVGTALVAARSRRRQLVVALAVTFVGALNMAGLASGHAGTPRGAIGTYEPQLVRLLQQKGVTRGYAGYWDAANLSWQSGMKVLVAPIEVCGSGLCGYDFTTIKSWYEPHPGGSFLIVDPTTAFLTQPPPVVKKASATYRFGPLRVYLFPYDLARDMHPPET